MNCLLILVFITFLQFVGGVGPNFDDIDLSLEQPSGEVITIEQSSPQSNSIHIAHNVPTGSKIKVKQNDAFNSSIHISLNIARDSDVDVEIDGMVTCSLHVALNIAANCNVRLKVVNPFNSSIHASFQNPVNTPADVNVEMPTLSNIHVSQNVPKNSPVTVFVKEPTESDIHVSQSSPIRSPMTVTIEANSEAQNGIEISQSSPDEFSPKICTPECPETRSNAEDYNYDYYGDHEAELEELQQFYEKKKEQRLKDSETDFLKREEIRSNVADKDDGKHRKTEYSDNSKTPVSENKGKIGNDTTNPQVEKNDFNIDIKTCPGGDLDQCIDSCPGFHTRAFSLCVEQCGKRCQ